MLLRPIWMELNELLRMHEQDYRSFYNKLCLNNKNPYNSRILMRIFYAKKRNTQKYHNR